MSTPDVFEIRNPYIASNSGAGHEDPEYAAMKRGMRIEQVKRDGCDDEAILYRYSSVRTGGGWRERRYGVVVYVGTLHTVHSFRKLKDAQVAFAQAERRVLGLPGPSGEAGDVAAQ